MVEWSTPCPEWIPRAWMAMLRSVEKNGGTENRVWLPRTFQILWMLVLKEWVKIPQPRNPKTVLSLVTCVEMGGTVSPG